MSIEKIGGQIANIFETSAQRGKLNAYDVNSIEEVLAKASLRDFVLEIPVRCTNYIEPNTPVFLASNSTKLPILQ